MYSDMMSISPEVMKAWKEKRNGAVVGKGTLERFGASDGWKVGSVIPFTTPIWPAQGKDHWEFEIVGTYDKTKQTADNTSFLFRYDFFDEARERAKGEVAIQGNFDPARLYSTPEVIRQEVAKMLNAASGAPGYIANLGHGILEDVPVENAQAFVDAAKASV